MSNKLIRTKTIKPTLKDKVKGCFHYTKWMLISLFKGDIATCKLCYILLKETKAGRFDVVVKEK